MKASASISEVLVTFNDTTSPTKIVEESYETMYTRLVASLERQNLESNVLVAERLRMG